jgi:hypothetical protein
MENILKEAMTYNEYKSLIEKLLKEGKTTGTTQNAELVNFTELNQQRMNRVEKQFKIRSGLENALQKLNQHLTWLILAEAWCGDCAQNIPALAKIAEYSNNKIHLKIIISSEYPEVLDNYLTNGTRSIPKLISFDDHINELFVWGPRPFPAQEILYHYKENKDKMSWDDFEKKLHFWYAKDKSVTLQEELAAHIDNLTHNI